MNNQSQNPHLITSISFLSPCLFSQVDNPDFHVERSITAASASSGGTEVNVEVIYEPSCLGNSRATLLLTSPMGGDYTFPLYGYAAPPKPQGPYTIKAGASASIPFKNVFPQATQFTFHVDNPVFSVKPTETIRAKKVHNVVVTFDGNQGNAKTTRMGRLVVASASSASLTHNIEWVYYLKGVTP
jgi:hydrocephalus-inducing protein